MEEYKDELDKEMSFRERFSGLLDNPNVESYQLASSDEEVVINENVKKILAGSKAQEFTTGKSFMEYIEGKVTPKVYSDKYLLFELYEGDKDDVATTDKGLYVPHSTHKTTTTRKKGDKDFTQEYLNRRCVIVEMGEGFTTPSGEFIKMSYSKGMEVMIPGYAGTTIEFDGITYIILRDYDILCELPEINLESKDG